MALFTHCSDFQQYTLHKTLSVADVRARNMQYASFYIRSHGTHFTIKITYLQSLDTTELYCYLNSAVQQ
jgi:hypothetical protein